MSYQDPAPEFTKATRRARIAEGSGVGDENMRQRMALIAAALLVAAGLVRTQQGPAGTRSAVPPGEVIDATGWVCPMHSDYTADGQGTCPRCGMALVHDQRHSPTDRLRIWDVRGCSALVQPARL